MRTVRRLYLYTVALVSLEVVLWGLIGLARSALSPDLVASGSTRLAQALALILVGVPVFLVHWLIAQRQAAQDTEEHASGVRAFFLYVTLLAILIPIIQNLFALINHLLVQVFNIPEYPSLFNLGQAWSENLVAILMNALVAAYFLSILRKDWQAVAQQDALVNQRRLYRLVWVVYGLVMLVAGVQQLLHFILYIPSTQVFGASNKVAFVNGLSLLLVGVPLFYYAWQVAQNALADPRERASLLRLGLLYILALSGVISVLSSAGVLADTFLRLALGESKTLPDVFSAINSPLAIGIPLAGVWAYFSRWLTRSLNEVPDAPRRAGLRRLYFYILSAVGLTATVIALSLLMLFIIDLSLSSAIWGQVLRPRLSAALAVLLVGFPLWWFTWSPMQAEALQSGDSGDHARRSLVRRIYLYLALFASVIGGMIVTGGGLFLILSAVLGDRQVDFLRDLLNNLQLLILFVLLGYYHGATLRRDGQRAAEALTRLHAAFPVLLLDPGDPAYAQELTQALTRFLPDLPVQVQPASQPLSAEKTAKYRAVLLPADLSLAPAPQLAKWLGAFTGTKLVLPRSAPGWFWSGLSASSADETIRQTAQTLRQLAEGQEVRPSSPSSGWKTAFFILLGLILAPFAISLVAQFLFR